MLCYLEHKFYPVSNAIADHTKECHSVLNNKKLHRKLKCHNCWLSASHQHLHCFLAENLHQEIPKHVGDRPSKVKLCFEV